MGNKERIQRFNERNPGKQKEYQKTFFAKPENKHKKREYVEENKATINSRLKRRKKEKKEYLLKLFGGKCKKCGYDECIAALVFHHVDPSQKDFSIARMLNMKLEKLIVEASKCLLLCANCHAELHYKLGEEE